MNNAIKNNTTIIFGIGFLFVFLYGLYMRIDVTKYWYDSADYYNASKSFILNDNFSFLHYSNTYRGYFFPFLLCVYTTIGNLFHIPDWISILFGTSLLTSVILILLLPNILKRTIGLNDEIKPFMRLLPLLFVLIYWKDLIYYPLTDFYSFALMLCSIKLIMSMIYTSRFVYLKGVLLGCTLYATYNIRPIYQFIIPILILIYIIYRCKEKRNLSKIVIGILCIVVGIFICATPQILINKKLHLVETLKIITDDLNGGDIFYSQLYMGLIYDRYESFVGDPNMYPVPAVNFLDASGIQIFANEGINQIHSLKEYLLLIIKYPFDYIGIMVRHLANILYLPYNQVYINDLNNHKPFFMILNYSILFCFYIWLRTVFVDIKSRKHIKWITENKLYLFSTLIPCIAILPGAIELRFFLPVYIIIYGILANLQYKNYWRYLKTNWKHLVITYSIAFILLLGFWGACMSSAQDLPQLLK